MISFSKLGTHGRLANQLFQIAATIGIAEKNNTWPSLPNWNYENYFENKLPRYTDGRYSLVEKEKNFYHDDYVFKGVQNRDLLGYFQSEKYFPKNAKEVFKFKGTFLEVVKEKLPNNGKQNIGIHIRRGDYVNNPNYYHLPITYYIDSLIQIPNWQDYNIVIFSDDLDYCKAHFECLTNAYFPELNDIETIAAGQFCEHFILSNSTYSWWIAWLGEKEGSKVIHPGHLFAGVLLKNDTKDFWPERWVRNQKESYSIDLTDTTFTIPVFYDHPDRKKNLQLSVCMLQMSFNTNIIIGEKGGPMFEFMSQWCQYVRFEGMRYFHRTKMLNDMCKMSNTHYVVNWDADIIIVPMQIYLAVKELRNGTDIVFPYDGRFARWDRNLYFSKIEKSLDIATVIKGIHPRGNRGVNIDHQTSVGGAVFVNKKSFIEAGMENEKMISFGPEDCERNDRFTMLGLNIKRVKGYLHHINHWVGVDSSVKNPFFKANHAEINKIRAMNKFQLKTYISTWPWLKK